MNDENMKTMRLKTPLKLFILLYLFCPFQGQGQTFVPFSANGVCGYLNSEDRIVIEPRFEEARVFYPNARTPNQRLGQVKENGLWGVINDEGEYILEPKFDTIASLEISTTKGKLIRVFKGGRDQYYDNEGRRVRRFDYRYNSICGKAFYLGCLRAESLDLLDIESVQEERAEKYNLISKWHETIDDRVQEVYDTVQVMVDSIYILRNWVFLEKEGKTSIINRRDIYGRSEDLMNQINFDYDELVFTQCLLSTSSGAYDKYVQVRIKDKWGVIYLGTDSVDEFEIIVEPVYKSIIRREETYFLVEYDDGRSGYVSFEGHEYW